jgi:hypothetical protein
MNKANDSQQTPPTVKVRNLDTLAGVRAELTRIYRLTAKNVGKGVLPQDATRLASVLATIGTLIKDSDLEKRIQAIEARFEKR